MSEQEEAFTIGERSVSVEDVDVQGDLRRTGRSGNEAKSFKSWETCLSTARKTYLHTSEACQGLRLIRWWTDMS